MKLKMMIGLVSIFAVASVKADCTADGYDKVRSATVKWIGACNEAGDYLVAEMSNNERLLVGKQDDAMTKIRMSLLFQAQALSLPVSYAWTQGTQRNLCQSSAPTYGIQWLSINRSDCGHFGAN